MGWHRSTDLERLLHPIQIVDSVKICVLDSKSSTQIACELMAFWRCTPRAAFLVRAESCLLGRSVPTNHVEICTNSLVRWRRMRVQTSVCVLWLRTAFGPIAQLEERFNGIEEAVGSSPTGSTRKTDFDPGPVVIVV